MPLELEEPPKPVETNTAPAAAAPAPAAKTESKPWDYKDEAAKFRGFIEKSLAPKKDAAKDEPAKAPVDEPAKVTEAKVPEKKPEAPAAKPRDAKGKFQPRRPAAPRREVDLDKVAEASARGAAKAFADVEARRTAGPEFKMPPEAESKLEVLTKMEELFPASKGTSAKFKSFIQNQESYAAQWEKDHPGEAFDAEAEEHEAWYAKNTPAWDETLYNRALSRIEAEAVAKGPLEEVKRLKDELQQRDRMAQSQTKIHAAQNEAAKSFIAATGDKEIEALYKADGTFDMEKWNGIKESDPDKFALLQRSGMEINTVAAIAETVFGGLEEFNPNNPNHQYFNAECSRAEADMIKSIQEGGSDLDEQGRHYLPAQEYAELLKSKSPDAQFYWSLNAAVVTAFAAKDRAVKLTEFVKKRDSDFEKFATRRGFVKNNGSNGSQTAPAKTAPEPTSGREKVQSPSANVDAVPANPRLQAPSGPKTTSEVLKGMFASVGSKKG